MDIGKPKRIYRVEPLREPVPSWRPEEAPRPAPQTPEPAPAK